MSVGTSPSPLCDQLVTEASELIDFDVRVISGAGNFCLIHVSLVPVLNVVGEQVMAKLCVTGHFMRITIVCSSSSSI